MTGTLYGLGMGPGDPDLITLRTARILGQAPVIAYPAPLRGPSMVRAIAAPHLPGTQAEVVLRFSFDPAEGPPEAVYDRGAEDIAAHLDAGRDVAMLCEGDPFLFGSFQYVYARLCERYPVTVVPGISSVMACAARLGHALTAREDALAVIPATKPEAEIEALLRAAQSAAIMKVGRHLPKVKAVLDRLGLTDQARYMERAGLPEERICSLDEALAGGAPYFSMILVHKRGTAWR